MQCFTWHLSIQIYTKHYESNILHDTLQYPDTDVYQTLWSHCSTWHVTISWHWYVANIMNSLFYMTRYNILTLICTEHYGAIVLHDRLQYPDTDMYRTLWSHCPTWHVTISWHWYAPNIMEPLSYMTRYNILTLICTEHYEAIVLHDTLQYPDTDMYQTLWNHCSTWQLQISWCWCVPNIMKPLFYITHYNILTLMCTKHYEAIVYMTRYNIMTLMCTKHYEFFVIHDTLQYHDADVYQTLWSHCSTWHVTISWRWCVPNIMNSLFYMTRYNIMTLMCTKHYEFIVLHDTLQYHDADVYQTLWIHCSTWHVTISWRWCVPNIMNSLFYMTRYNIMTLMCTKHYEFIVLHDTLQYHDADVHQTLWSHCFTWHVTISKCWCVPNIMKPLFYMTPYNILTLMCTKHYEAIVLHDTLQYHDADVYQTLWSHCSTWHVTISWRWCVPNNMKPLSYLTRYNIQMLICTKHYEYILQHDTIQTDIYKTLWSYCSTWHLQISWSWCVPNIMKPLFYMTAFNTDMYKTIWNHCATWHLQISWCWCAPNTMEPLFYSVTSQCSDDDDVHQTLSVQCFTWHLPIQIYTKHYESNILHDTLQYPDTDVYQTLWSHCSTWHVTISWRWCVPNIMKPLFYMTVTISWRWCVPNIMKPLFYMTRYNIMTLMCTKHYEAIVLHDTLQYHDADVYQTLWSHCSTWHVTISWRWCVPNIMNSLFYMTRYNIMTLMCTKHYEAIVLHDTLQYPDADVYQLIWSHCPTWHVTISRCWCVPNIMKPLFYMTPHNILKLMCTKHYEAIVLHDTLQYPDADVYQIIWSHCPTWHVTISWRWCVPNNMKPLSYMTRYNIQMLICTKHYEYILQHDTIQTDIYKTLWSYCSTWHLQITWCWCVPNIMKPLFYMTAFNTDMYKTLWNHCSTWHLQISWCWCALNTMEPLFYNVTSQCSDDDDVH